MTARRALPARELEDGAQATLTTTTTSTTPTATTPGTVSALLQHEPGARDRVRPRVETRDLSEGPRVETSDLTDDIGLTEVTVQDRIRAAARNKVIRQTENTFDDCGEDFTYTMLDVDGSMIPEPTLLAVCFGSEEEPYAELEVNARELEDLYDESFFCWWMIGSSAECCVDNDDQEHSWQPSEADAYERECFGSSPQA